MNQECYEYHYVSNPFLCSIIYDQTSCMHGRAVDKGIIAQAQGLGELNLL